MGLKPISRTPECSTRGSHFTVCGRVMLKNLISGVFFPVQIIRGLQLHFTLNRLVFPAV